MLCEVFILYYTRNILFRFFCSSFVIVDFRLLVDWLLAIRCWLMTLDCCLFIGYCLLDVSYWLLDVGCWPLAVGRFRHNARYTLSATPFFSLFLIISVYKNYGSPAFCCYLYIFFTFWHSSGCLFDSIFVLQNTISFLLDVFFLPVFFSRFFFMRYSCRLIFLPVSRFFLLCPFLFFFLVILFYFRFCFLFFFFIFVFVSFFWFVPRVQQTAVNKFTGGFDGGGGFSTAFPTPDYQAQHVHSYIESGAGPPSDTFNSSSRYQFHTSNSVKLFFIGGFCSAVCLNHFGAMRDCLDTAP